MLDTGVPENCEGTPYGWMLIKQEYTAMSSVVLAVWTANKNREQYIRQVGIMALGIALSISSILLIECKRVINPAF